MDAPYLIGFGLLVVVPVVALLTEHQRKLAEIKMKGLRGAQDVEALERRVKDLEDRVNQVVLDQDDLKVLQRSALRDELSARG